MIFGAAALGLEETAWNVFRCISISVCGAPELIENSLYEIAGYKNEIRFIAQIIASPIYGEKMRSEIKRLDSIYEKNVQKLAELKPIMVIYISAAVGYALTENEETAKEQLKIVSGLLERLGVFPRRKVTALLKRFSY